MVGMTRPTAIDARGGGGGGGAGRVIASASATNPCPITSLLVLSARSNLPRLYLDKPRRAVLMRDRG